MRLLTILGVVLCWTMAVHATPVGEYKILVGPGASPAEKTAGNELSTFFGQITGKKLPIVETTVNGPLIKVGQTSMSPEIFGLKSWQELKPDEILLRRVGNDIYVAGDRPRGTLYAAYELLERYFGVRFWTAEVTRVPVNAVAEFPARLDYRYAPPFMMRSAGFDLAGHWAGVRNDRFAARSRNNGQLFEQIKPEWGGGIYLIGQVHTFTANCGMFNAEDMKRHPEWFAFNNGRRCLDIVLTQPCLTNKELRKEWARRAIARLDSVPNPQFISLSQNDNGPMCRCPECTRFVKEHGNDSDLLIDAMNEIGAIIAQKYPHVYVETLAYQSTEAPPKTVIPAPNIAPRVCPIFQRIFRPIRAKINQRYADAVIGWSKKSKQMMVWSYITNYWKYYLPLPNWRVIGDDLRFYRDNGVISIYEQGSYNNCGSLADLGDLRTWLVSKLLWNPSLDANTLINEFLNGYYGKAAPAVREYIDLMLKSLDRHPEIGGFCGMSSTTDWLDHDIMFQAYRCMDQAYNRFKDDPVLGNRVLAAWAPIGFALVERIPLMHKSPVDRDTVIKRLQLAMSRTGIKSLAESSLTPEKWLETLNKEYDFEKNVTNDGEPPAIAKGNKCFYWDYEKHHTIMHMTATHCFVVDDPAASGGKGVTFPATNVEWMLERRDLPIGRYDIYVEARCEGKVAVPDGNAFTVGVYSFSKNETNGKHFKAEEFVGKKYKPANFGTFDFTGDQCVFVCPAVNSQVSRIFIDRLILVKAKN